MYRVVAVMATGEPEPQSLFSSPSGFQKPREALSGRKGQRALSHGSPGGCLRSGLLRVMTE